MLDWTSNINSYDFNVISSNGVRSLLLDKYMQATEHGIQCRFTVLLPEKLRVEEIQLISLIINILSNAIAASTMAEPHNRYIKLDIHYNANLIFITCENSMSHSTLKKIKYGNGLRYVLSLKDIYQGAMNITTKNNVFTLELVL